MLLNLRFTGMLGIEVVQYDIVVYVNTYDAVLLIESLWQSL